MKNRKTLIIIIVIVLFVIIVSIASFLIYKNNKKKKEKQKQELAAQMLLLQQQANSNSTPPAQKADLLAQLAALAEQIKSINETGEVMPNQQQTQQQAPAGFPLAKGSKNQFVVNLQKGLNAKCNSKLVPDGAFGNLTESALKKCFSNSQADFALYNTIIS
jgi:type II secretory pathway pseudopilin PulG